ncbi:uracil-DNA glycosylase [Nocardioides marmoriginsengisoli]|uniref:Type-5 uracil-DNA glycosylase n=1 Tax=Nocardioides marmoriginsengisoli TaxID=661483 RepID=A0A3N0CE24_9ACTN|nr:uracil-DNA glycosylase [Nocardioides marmoriginsengisoli]RNL61253.1 uracil-DNA glycosylase [Nocardioides marmoriginsengisoli]
MLPHPITGQLFASPVPAGSGWPEDPAAPTSPVARTAAEVAVLAAVDSLAELDARVSVCAACPRLVTWREDVAATKRASFANQPYWGRPIAGWGSAEPPILIVGLAPAANGGNRTGRIFTGDSSGDWLFASLHRVGLARTATSVHAGDGQGLIGARMAAAVRCAPPENKPTPGERDTCAPWIAREVELVATSLRVVVTLGGFGWAAALKALRDAGFAIPKPQPKFGHAHEVVLEGPSGPITLLGCYHPSQHNTFTGRLTPEMLDAVFRRAQELAGA